MSLFFFSWGSYPLPLNLILYVELSAVTVFANKILSVRGTERKREREKKKVPRRFLDKKKIIPAYRQPYVVCDIRFKCLYLKKRTERRHWLCMSWASELNWTRRLRRQDGKWRCKRKTKKIWQKATSTSEWTKRDMKEAQPYFMPEWEKRRDYYSLKRKKRRHTHTRTHAECKEAWGSGREKRTMCQE